MKKKAWVRPMVQMITAGAAESSATGTRNENAVKGNDKS